VWRMEILVYLIDQLRTSLQSSSRRTTITAKPRVYHWLPPDVALNVWFVQGAVQQEDAAASFSDTLSLSWNGGQTFNLTPEQVQGLNREDLVKIWTGCDPSPPPPPSSAAALPHIFLGLSRHINPQHTI